MLIRLDRFFFYMCDLSFDLTLASYMTHATIFYFIKIGIGEQNFINFFFFRKKKKKKKHKYRFWSFVSHSHLS
jgi:hypothetical protein